MASIYIDRQSGNWKLKVKVDGRDKRISLRKAHAGEHNGVKPPDVLALARKHDASFRSEKRASTPPKPTPSTPNPDSILEFMDWFGMDYPKHKASGTAVKMERILRFFRQHLQGKDCPVAAITADTVRAWAESRLADPRVSGQTIKSDLIYLSALFKQALEREFITRNPVSRVLKEYKKAYPAKETIKYLTDSEIKAFLAELDGMVDAGTLALDYADLFKVMLATGMRVSAAVNLCWDWITPDWTIKVPATTDAIPTKTKTGYTAAIADLGREVLSRRQLNGATGRVFPGITDDSAYWRLRRRFNIHPHQLRHSFATSLVSANTPIQTIGGCLGQRDLKTTMIYAKVLDQTKIAAVAALPF